MKDKLFFSYATVAPMSEVAYRATKKYLDDFYEVGPPQVLYSYDPIAEDLAKEAARLLHCDASEITYTKNTTEAITIAAESLPLQPGDEVLILGEEYPANLLPWLKKRKDGITVTVIKDLHGPEAIDALLARITPQTKVISLSSAQYYDGYMADLSLVADRAQSHGIFLVVDAVQTIGIRQLDLQSMRIAMLACGGQKYLQAGPGIGFLYVNKDIMGQLRDYKVGIRSMTQFDDDQYHLRTTASRFQDGTQNLAGIVALHAALQAINQTGIAEIEKKNNEMLVSIKECLASYAIPMIDHHDHQSNIISLPVQNPKGLVDFLAQNNVYIKQIKDVARISFMAHSRIEDVDKLAQLTHEWLTKQ